jgi:hypothetical protein
VSCPHLNIVQSRAEQIFYKHTNRRDLCGISKKATGISRKG